MSEKGVELDREKISCPMCSDILKVPVTIPCGHSYCMSCIGAHWDKEEEATLHSCPQCKQTFTQRPVLEKSAVLSLLVEDLTQTGQEAAADHCYARNGDVACDVCTGRKRKAHRTCMQCMVSYCQEDLQPHFESPAFKKHKLVKPSKKLQDGICSRHNQVMKMFCRTDHKIVCYLCVMKGHKGHDTVSAAEERTERQRELEGIRLNIQQRIQDGQKKVKLLQQEVEALNDSADKAVEHSEEMFNELIRLYFNRRSEVKQRVRSQQETEVSRVKEHQEKLEQEITELKRRDAELQKLSHTEEHYQFLNHYSSLSGLSEPTYASSIKTRSLWYFEDVTVAVSQLRNKLQELMREEWTNISQTVTEVDVLLSQPAAEPEPKTRAEFLRYSRDIVLDPKTAHTQLLLSDGNRKVTLKTTKQSYCDHPDRFTDWSQVLSRESLTGRCYWEVEWKGRGVYVAVACKNISRAGDSIECGLGRNDKSWAVHCYNNICNFWFNNVSTLISAPQSSRVGVYLDRRAGILSFYSINETMTLLHRVQTTFTQPLYAGLWIYWFAGSTAEFCKPREQEVI